VAATSKPRRSRRERLRVVAGRPARRLHAPVCRDAGGDCIHARLGRESPSRPAGRFIRNQESAMLDPERLLGQMLSGALGGALGGKSHKRHKDRSGGLGGLLGSNPAAKAQLGIGLLGVAMAAWEHYSNQPRREAAAMAGVPQTPANATPPPPPPPPATSPAALASDATRAAPVLDLRRQQAVLLIRAMIAAAAADGAIDDAERAAILERARGLGDDAESLDFLRAELAAPLDAEQLVAQTPRSLSNEVYAAAALAITIDTEAERAWLDRLALRLGIAPETREALHREIGLVV
jgi:uncharacterized membrane protein YebE (DUF533 family)